MKNIDTDIKEFRDAVDIKGRVDVPSLYFESLTNSIMDNVLAEDDKKLAKEFSIVRVMKPIMGLVASFVAIFFAANFAVNYVTSSDDTVVDSSELIIAYGDITDYVMYETDVFGDDIEAVEIQLDLESIENYMSLGQSSHELVALMEDEYENF